MFPRFHNFTAYLLLAAWPMTIGLATGWHVHTHVVTCDAEDCQQAADTHDHGGHEHAHHSHEHHHGHGHSHSHHDEKSGASEESNDPCPTCPHDSEDCQSCQVLALSGTVFTITLVEPDIEVLASADSFVRSLISSRVPTCFYLRGPPAWIAV